MELKDLRIGSILIYKNNYVYITSLSIDFFSKPIDEEYTVRISFSKVGEIENAISDWTRVLCYDLRSVPLTPDIIDICGFINGQLSLPTISFIYFKYTIDRKSISLYHTSTYLWVEIHYLHELQNIYIAMCGEELKINFK